MIDKLGMIEMVMRTLEHMPDMPCNEDQAHIAFCRAITFQCMVWTNIYGPTQPESELTAAIKALADFSRVKMVPLA